MPKKKTTKKVSKKQVYYTKVELLLHIDNMIKQLKNKRDRWRKIIAMYRRRIGWESEIYELKIKVLEDAIADLQPDIKAIEKEIKQASSTEKK